MKEEMSHGVKIILERLRDFPADFATSGPYLSVGRYHSNTWVDMAAHIIDRKEVFTDEERKAVRDALRIAQRLQFDAAVMDLLAKPPRVDQDAESMNGTVIGTGLVATDSGWGAAKIIREGGNLMAQERAANRLTQGIQSNFSDRAKYSR